MNPEQEEHAMRNQPTPRELETIRQYAGQAMQALIIHDGLSETDAAREEFALWSYRMAQAMLKKEKELGLS